MIDWAIPQPRSTNAKRCAFWPDSCFLEISGVPELDELLALGRGERELDLASSAGETLGLIGHENIHWIQATGLGYGHYQAIIDQARTEIAESFFGLISSEQSRALLGGRRDGHPVLLNDKRGELRENPSLGALALRLQRHWLGLGLLRYTLEKGLTVGDQASKLRFYLGLARLYSRVGPHVSEVALMSDRDLLDAALSWAPEGEIYLADQNGVRLSSASIAECSAVLDEHWFYAYQSEWCRQHGRVVDSNRWWSTLDESWRSREPTFYGEAFRIFAEINPSLDLNEPAPLATLGVICFLSLNGPWMFEDRSRRPLWRDLYPPFRFHALSEVIAKVGVIPSYSVYQLSADKFRVYTSQLCEEAGLTQPERSVPALITTNWEPSPNNDLRRLFAQCSDAAGRLTLEYPVAIVAPSEANVYLQEVLVREELQPFRLAREAPLLILNDEMSSLHFDVAQIEQFATAGIYQRLMLELLRGKGQISKAGRPLCERGEGLVRSAINLAERRLSIELTEFAIG